MHRQQRIALVTSFLGVFGLLWVTFANTYRFDSSILLPTAVVALVMTALVFLTVSALSYFYRLITPASCAHLADSQERQEGFTFCKHCRRFALDE